MPTALNVVALMSPMRASTSAAGRNANGTAVEIRSTADAVALLSDSPENENARAKGAAGRVAF